MGKPAATDRPALRSLSHSFTLDWVVLCNGTKAEALAMKEELRHILDHMGLKLSEEKTQVTHITEGFNFLGYRIMRSMGQNGKMIPKILIPDGAIKKFQHKMCGMLAPSTNNESIKGKILALNGLTRGWCEYYRSTSSPSSIFSALSHELYWLMAHWLGRKYKMSIPGIMRKYKEGNTFKAGAIKLVLPQEYKAKKFLAKTWHNPYTGTETITREILFSPESIWTGYEDRHGSIGKLNGLFHRPRRPPRASLPPVRGCLPSACLAPSPWSAPRHGAHPPLGPHASGSIGNSNGLFHRPPRGASAPREYSAAA